jgi:hypothetical protein
MEFPNFQPPIGFQPCAVPTPSCAGAPRKAGVAVAARRDGAGNDALAFAVALNCRAELLDHAHRLVADGQALPDRIFALENMDVGTADGRSRNADQRIQRTDVGDWLFFKHDASKLDEDRSSHLGHVCFSFAAWSESQRYFPPYTLAI